MWIRHKTRKLVLLVDVHDDQQKCLMKDNLIFF